ncbi:MAG: gamma-glutamyltransferase [Gammaproteobacteria bacterium]|nr:gamma-glutamyltransferase [Gammaproteobacteria bacterium]
MTKTRGVVAAGHEVTAQAAAMVLAEGGNAFDAALTALFASCVAEPVLASLGGGGFLLSRKTGQSPLLYDFFAHTPRRKKPSGDVDFYPIVADFGTAQQEFHIGVGSIATPGMVKGIFSIHRDLCRMPLDLIVEPARAAARRGVTINTLQHYITDVISPIIESSPGALRLHAESNSPDQIAKPGATLYQREMADTFEHFAREGGDLFYLGEIGQELIRECRERGGYLREEDLSAYKVEKRLPLELDYHGFRLFANPAPSLGGTLIAFSLALLETEKLGSFKAGDHDHLLRIAQAQELTQRLRRQQGVDLDLSTSTAKQILSQEYLQNFRSSMAGHHQFPRGTTQISVMDTEGNMASMTLSNGEGSGYVIPETGIMMNNMLGEEDINPHGFHRWPTDRRIASMMAPTLVTSDQGYLIATGSGGSNRIRSAVLQVLVNLLEFGMDIESAVEQPRIHYESNLLNLETGPAPDTLEQLWKAFPEHRLWPGKNLFFGGAHTVMSSGATGLTGKGDSRRGGVCIVV